MSTMMVQFRLSGVPASVGTKMIEIDSNMSIADVKTKVQDSYKLNKMLSVQLIYGQKVIGIDKLVKDLEILDNSAITVMATHAGGSNGELEVEEIDYGGDELIFIFSPNKNNRPYPWNYNTHHKLVLAVVISNGCLFDMEEVEKDGITYDQVVDTYLLPTLDEIDDSIKLEYMCGEPIENFNYFDLYMNRGLTVPFHIMAFDSEKVPDGMILHEGLLMCEDGDFERMARELVIGRVDAIFGLIGFILDRPLNGLGNTGWDMLKELTTGRDVIAEKIKSLTTEDEEDEEDEEDDEDYEICDECNKRFKEEDGEWLTYYHSPFSDEPRRVLLCSEECSQDYEQSGFFYCDECSRVVANDDGRMTYYRMDGYEPICLRCYEEKLYEQGHDIDEFNSRGLPGMFLNDGDAESHGFEYCDTKFVRSDSSIQYVKDWGIENIENGYAVIVEIMSSGMGLEGTVKLWRKKLESA